MNKLLKKDWGTVIAVILVLSFLFFWFSWRPSQIKKECAVVEPPDFSPGWIAEKEKFVEQNCGESVFQIFQEERDSNSECLLARSQIRQYYQGPRPANDDEYKQCLRSSGL